MRVTNSMLTANFLRDLYMNTDRMSFYQRQMSTQKRIVRLSQDPVGVVSVLKSREKLRDIKLYRENIQTSKDWLVQTETAASELNEVLKRVRELTVQAANDSNSDDARQAIAAEANQLKQHVVTMLNSTSTNKYLFSGYNVTKTPFEMATVTGSDGAKYDVLIFNKVPMHDVVDPSAGNVSLLSQVDPAYTDFSVCEPLLDAMQPEALEYKVGFELMMDISVHGLDFLGKGDTNIFKVVSDIDRLLSGDRPEGVAGNDELNPMLAKIDLAQDLLLASIAGIGGKQNRLDLFESRYSLDAINYETTRSNVEDLDMAEASMNFMMAEAVYKAALSVGSRVIQPTLLDFLR